MRILAAAVLCAVATHASAASPFMMWPGFPYFIMAPPPVIIAPPPVVVIEHPPVVIESPPVVIETPPLPPLPPPVACAVVAPGPPLNLRTWPNGPLIAAYWAGTRVLVDGSNGGRWVHVVVGPVSGWMFAPYLVPVPCY